MAVGVLVATLALGLGTSTVSLPGEGLAEVTGSSCDGVVVIVDSHALAMEGDPRAGGTVACAPRDAATTTPSDGLEVLRDAGVQVEGTAQWGAAFVCRVDGRPAANEDVMLPDGGIVRELCERTPSTQAYWALWTAGLDGRWTYAQTGASDMALLPGAALGLVFSVGDGAPAPPTLSVQGAREGPPDADASETGWRWRTAGPAEVPVSSSGDQANFETAGTGLTLAAIALFVLMGLASFVLARRRR